MKRQRAVAIDAALDAGVLRACPIHVDCLYRPADLDPGAVQPAIYGRWSADAAVVFRSRQDLVDSVEQLVQDSAKQSCSICSAIAREKSAQDEAARVVYALAVEQPGPTAERARQS